MTSCLQSWQPASCSAGEYPAASGSAFLVAIGCLYLALSLHVQVLTVPGVGVLACGEYTHVELRSASFLVFFSLWHSLDQTSYSGFVQVGQVPTPELQPQTQALCRLGNATTE